MYALVSGRSLDKGEDITSDLAKLASTSPSKLAPNATESADRQPGVGTILNVLYAREKHTNLGAGTALADIVVEFGDGKDEDDGSTVIGGVVVSRAEIWTVVSFSK